MFSKTRKKLIHAMHDYVDSQLLPVTFEILMETAKSGFFPEDYDAYCRAVHARLACDQVGEIE